MKSYSVSLSRPAEGTKEYFNYKYNETTQEYEKTSSFHSRTFYDLKSAKMFIKENIDSYLDSQITKIYSNGDWENCGEIKLKGSNAIRMSNMKTYQY